MTAKPHSFLDVLAERASFAEKEETDLRAETAKLIGRLERDRVFAYRRLNLMRDMAGAAAAAATAEDGSAAAVMALCAEIGWERLTPIRQTIIGQLADLADALAETARAEPAEDAAPAAAARGARALEELARFEHWYEREFGQPFFALFDSYVPETPVVDF